MPIDDLNDLHAARDLEQALQAAVQRKERPPIELEWLLALPERVRASAARVRGAQVHSRPLLEHVRSTWDAAQRVEREREDRLARAKAQPRDLECLRASDTGAWQGVGRRKQRCRRFTAIGRAFSLHDRLAHPLPAPGVPAGPAVVPVLVVEREESLSPPSTPEVSRPATPEGLREAAFTCLGLLASASGVNGYGHNTPRPLPRQPPRVIYRPPSPVPPPNPPLPYEHEVALGNCTVNAQLAYILAMGRWEECKWQQPHTLEEAAGWARDMELSQPGMIDWLSDTFFPQGYQDWSLARPRSIFLRDFVLGWWALAPDGQ
ncbi:hypothetical protein BDV93DRAFT_563714 [Ceratobasidium sp. AG-I]|nr:hypothetical protein BDV93DRAFT_563714 [Ceratobasidium sp. AG-I]